MLGLRRRILTAKCDLAVIGSGFAGTILAMCAARIGLSVILLEKGSHPRFAIGESSTPLSNLLLEEIAERYSLPALQPLTKWGTWQRSYPEIACGLKRGFSFFHHDLDNPNSHGLQQALHVAASPNDNIADTHWYRADFDEFLVQRAQEIGVSFFDQLHIEEVIEGPDNVLLRGSHRGAIFEARAQFVVDATGPRGLLHNRLRLPEASLPGFPKTEALFGHFSGVKRLADSPHTPYTSSRMYPVDDAAVHHVFDGGWIWVLQFNNGVTSAGVAATTKRSNSLGLDRGEPAWRDLIAKIPILQEQFSDAIPSRPLTYTPQTSFRSGVVTGNRWALLPSAAGFVDPLLSTGFPLTLLGVTRLADIFKHHWNSSSFSSQLELYGSRVTEELLATSRLIAALYANMDSFAAFRSLSLLYFAAASFSETARRFHKPELAQSFLLCDHPNFGPASKALLETTNSLWTDPDALSRQVLRLIHSIDVAGLGKEPRDFCYPVRAEDLINNAWKLGATPSDAVSLLTRAGFYAAPA